LNWRPRLSITPADILPACRYCLVFGAVTGPVISVLLHWLFGRPMEEVSAAPLLWFGRAVVTGALSAVSFYLITGMPWVYLRAPFSRLPKGVRLALGAAISASSGAVFALVSITITRAIWGVRILPDSWVARLLVADAVILVLVGFAMGAYHETRLRAQLREQTLAEAAARAQAYALQAQIAPHFFFNCLNSISALIDSDPAAARVMLNRLAGIFRYTFTAGRAPLVPLEGELAFVREYLALEQIRYGERLRLRWPAEVPSPERRLPALSLQPLFENAIRHGIAKRMEGGEILVEIHTVGEALRIEIWNQFDASDGPPDLRPERLFREDHALSNVRDRLRLACGAAATLEVGHQGGDWIRTTLTLPLNRTEESDARPAC